LLARLANRLHCDWRLLNNNWRLLAGDRNRVWLWHSHWSGSWDVPVHHSIDDRSGGWARELNHSLDNPFEWNLDDFFHKSFHWHMYDAVDRNLDDPLHDPFVRNLDNPLHNAVIRPFDGDLDDAVLGNLDHPFNNSFNGDWAFNGLNHGTVNWAFNNAVNGDLNDLLNNSFIWHRDSAIYNFFHRNLNVPCHNPVHWVRNGHLPSDDTFDIHRYMPLDHLLNGDPHSFFNRIRHLNNP